MGGALRFILMVEDQSKEMQIEQVDVVTKRKALVDLNTFFKHEDELDQASRKGLVGIAVIIPLIGLLIYALATDFSMAARGTNGNAEFQGFFHSGSIGGEKFYDMEKSILMGRNGVKLTCETNNIKNLKVGMLVKIAWDANGGVCVLQSIQNKP